MNTTVKETIESLQELIQELKRCPEDAPVYGLYTRAFGVSLDLTNWEIRRSITKNSVDILF